MIRVLAVVISKVHVYGINIYKPPINYCIKRASTSNSPTLSFGPIINSKRHWRINNYHDYPRMYQVKYDASLRTVLSNFRFTLWGPAPHHSLKNRIFFWLPVRWASGFSGDHQQDHQCLWLLLCYSFILSFIACILLGIKSILLLLLILFCTAIETSYDK